TAPPFRSERLPFGESRREPTNSAYNLSPSTRSEPLCPSRHKTDRLRQCRRRRLRLRERETKISLVDSLNCKFRDRSEQDFPSVESGTLMNLFADVRTKAFATGTSNYFRNVLAQIIRPFRELVWRDRR